MLLIIRLSFVGPNWCNFIILTLLIQSATPYSGPMSTAKIYSAIPFGFDGHLVAVECDANRGLPALNIVGLPSRSIDESRQRIRSAINNSLFTFPASKLTVNLAPADIKKTGSHLDLPIALSILVASSQLLQSDVENKAFVGELALSGEIRPVRGIINIIETAKRNHLKQLFIPADNAKQAALVANDFQLIPVKNLREVWLQLKSISHISPLKQIVKNTEKDKHKHVLLDEICGQSHAKRAITIAVAGRHNILFYGAPGIGKTMLAEAARDLMPPPTLNERIEITKLNSLISSQSIIATTRPFRTPHHHITISNLIGGNQSLLPGEISLAHRGILFLDEFPEFTTHAIEALRTPLESKQITLSYLGNKITYPADFMLIAAMNPCPCGYLGTGIKECVCSPISIQNYRKKLSGPILDRIDMTVMLDPLNTSVLLKNTTFSTQQDASAKIQIQRAIRQQHTRFHDNTIFNSALSSSQIVQRLQLTPSAKTLLDTAANKLQLSARAYFKLIKVAQTIADLDQLPKIDEPQIAEALSYRQPF